MKRQSINIPNYLNSRGIKPSYQRIQILKYFQDNMNHPTVHEIYDSLVLDIPTLSKTTVYNTLKLFVEQGILDVILIEENEARYDWSMQVHGHFKCTLCGSISDINATIAPDSISSLKEYKINEQHIYIMGLCPLCQ